MSVDYRLLHRFEASRRRLAAARELLPEQWLDDPRPEVQQLNDHWVSIVASARAQQERAAVRAQVRPVVFLDER